MAMTPAEKMKAYRLRKKDAGFKPVTTWVKEGETIATPPQSTESSAQLKKEQEREREQWKKELKHQQVLAAQKEGRRLARLSDKSRYNGYISGICDAASFFIGKDRVDIAQHLLKYFMIDREKAEAALQEDKRTKSMTLEHLDKYGAWHEPPPIMR